MYLEKINTHFRREKANEHSLKICSTFVTYFHYDHLLFRKIFNEKKRKIEYDVQCDVSLTEFHIIIHK